MKKCFIFSVLLAILFASSCKKQVSNPTVEPSAHGHRASNEVVKKIAEQLSFLGILEDIEKKYPNQKIRWESLVLYGVLGDSLAHAVIPVPDSSGLVGNFVQVGLKNIDSVVNARLISYKRDYQQNDTMEAKARIARDLIALQQSNQQLPSGFLIDSAKKLQEVLPGITMKLKTKTGDNALLNSGGNCSMRFQIIYFISSSTLTPYTVNNYFFNRLSLLLPEIDILDWRPNEQYAYNYVSFGNQLYDFSTLQMMISSIWSETVMALDFIAIQTLSEDYQYLGCTVDPGDGSGGSGATPVQPTPEDPDPDICEPSIADVTAEAVLNAGMSTFGEDEYRLDGTPAVEDGVMTRKMKYRWTFYEGTLLHLSWKYKSYDYGVHKYLADGQWLWHSLEHQNVQPVGPVPFNMTVTVTNPRTAIEPGGNYAGVEFDYVPSLTIGCGSNFPITYQGAAKYAAFLHIYVDHAYTVGP